MKDKRKVFYYIANADRILTQRQEIGPEAFLSYQRDVVKGDAMAAVAALGEDNIYCNPLDEHPGLQIVFVAVTDFHELPGERQLPTVPAFLSRLNHG